MASSTKIATCSYCGTRAVLDLRGKARHELCCSACGAPLHLMKPLKSDKIEERRARSAPHADRDPPRRKSAKRRKKPARRLFEKIWDELEDIFD